MFFFLFVCFWLFVCLFLLFSCFIFLCFFVVVFFTQATAALTCIIMYSCTQRTAFTLAKRVIALCYCVGCFLQSHGYCTCLQQFSGGPKIAAHAQNFNSKSLPKVCACADSHHNFWTTNLKIAVFIGQWKYSITRLFGSVFYTHACGT